MGQPKIVLADDQHPILEIVSKLVGKDFDVVATVENGERVMDAVARLDV